MKKNIFLVMALLAGSIAPTCVAKVKSTTDAQTKAKRAFHDEYRNYAMRHLKNPGFYYDDLADQIEAHVNRVLGKGGNIAAKKIKRWSRDAHKGTGRVAMEAQSNPLVSQTLFDKAVAFVKAHS